MVSNLLKPPHPPPLLHNSGPLTERDNTVLHNFVSRQVCPPSLCSNFEPIFGHLESLCSFSIAVQSIFCHFFVFSQLFLWSRSLFVRVSCTTLSVTFRRMCHTVAGVFVALFTNFLRLVETCSMTEFMFFWGACELLFHYCLPHRCMREKVSSAVFSFNFFGSLFFPNF